MANQEQLEIIRQGVEAWADWRAENQDVEIDLSNADLDGVTFRIILKGGNFIPAFLHGANLSNASLRNTDLSHAHLDEANLCGANLTGTILFRTRLISANLSGAILSGSQIVRAYLWDANLSKAILQSTFFNFLDLATVNFSGSVFGNTTFSDVDLSKALNLEDAVHTLPSTIGIDTLYRSKGKITEGFLRGCGVPEDLISYIPSLIGSNRSIIYNSCFISYSNIDEDFAWRLHSKMREAKLRVWFAPEDMKGGKEIFEQIDSAIQVHDKLLLVLSISSMKSNWVAREIKKAFKTEEREMRRKLFPIRLVDFETLQDWELNDGDSGKDLAAEIRKYYIPDFSKWKDHDSFEAGFSRLLRDLKAEE